MNLTCFFSNLLFVSRLTILICKTVNGFTLLFSFENHKVVLL